MKSLSLFPFSHALSTQSAPGCLHASSPGVGQRPQVSIQGNPKNSYSSIWAWLVAKPTTTTNQPNKQTNHKIQLYSAPFPSKWLWGSSLLVHIPVHPTLSFFSQDLVIPPLHSTRDTFTASQTTSSHFLHFAVWILLFLYLRSMFYQTSDWFPECSEWS